MQWENRERIESITELRPYKVISDLKNVTLQPLKIVMPSLKNPEDFGLNADTLCMKRSFLVTILFAGFFMMAFPSSARASDGVGLVLRGLVKTVGAAFAIPATMMQDSSQVMFPFGIISGAIRGSAKTIAGTVSGAVDMARGAAPYAKYAALAL